MGNFFQGAWNGIVWLGTPFKDTQQIKQDGQKIGQNVTNTVNSVSDLVPTIKNDLEWLIIALVGLLAYAFIFKR